MALLCCTAIGYSVGIASVLLAMAGTIMGLALYMAGNEAGEIVLRVVVYVVVAMVISMAACAAKERWF